MWRAFGRSTNKISNLDDLVKKADDYDYIQIKVASLMVELIKEEGEEIEVLLEEFGKEMRAEIKRKRREAESEDENEDGDD